MIDLSFFIPLLIGLIVASVVGVMIIDAQAKMLDAYDAEHLQCTDWTQWTMEV